MVQRWIIKEKTKDPPLRGSTGVNQAIDTCEPLVVPQADDLAYVCHVAWKSYESRFCDARRLIQVDDLKKKDCSSGTFPFETLVICMVKVAINSTTQWNTNIHQLSFYVHLILPMAFVKPADAEDGTTQHGGGSSSGKSWQLNCQVICLFFG